MDRGLVTPGMSMSRFNRLPSGEPSASLLPITSKICYAFATRALYQAQWTEKECKCEKWSPLHIYML